MTEFESTRLEIISDVVSERHVAEKFLYHIGNTVRERNFNPRLIQK
jgi:hypothetical protein